VKTLFENLRKLAWSDERNALLYRCPVCGTFWEMFAYEPAASQLPAGDVAKFYPGVAP
jgi:hypothetical protein